ncbi:hypothetical protein [Pseudalkalibacillus hwajinpoensis]|uniref:Uncharacterized protein n=1 Tax=Guptibacillus hwajinpoensis TaxID=208199 RepID=A0A4U1MM79_9BACL|nr:hypothetical protein [Pseudalkalibacillus hwajinpoensis]TKD71854.1 hypothetical protein FBF83_03375 [Pseudalkalibacillus hwajinpoensis]
MQGEKLSYSRLITRTKYFQEKSLELEKELIFANDQIASLEKQIESSKENEDIIVQLKEELIMLKKELEKQSNEQSILKTELEGKQKTVFEDSGSESLAKIKSYEDLLATMQVEINDKDKRLQHYQGKIKNLEKRAQYQENHTINEDEEQSEAVDELYAISYFNTSLILDKKHSVIIRGDLQIENCGTKNLRNPLVCFRFRPTETAVLKGKIYPIEQAETRSLDSKEGVQWVFPDHDWLEKAKDKGEIWVSPLHPVTLKPGEQIGIESFQIPIRSEFKEPVIIEGFVYFQKENYRIKVSNQIVISY